MKNQHTPGPWAVSPYNNIVSKNGTVAKTEQMPGNDDEERKANAHLIAAAPDLLSALHLLLDKLHAHAPKLIANVHTENAIVKAEMAISKAEGVA